MIRKAALVNCVDGPWVSTAGMRAPHLHVQGPEDLVLSVSHQSHGVPHEPGVCRGPGTHKLLRADWTKLQVLHGDSDQVLCFIISGAA